MFRYNSEGVDLEGKDPVPAGQYALEIVGVRDGYSREGKHPQVCVNFSVVDGPYQGRHVPFHYVTFMPQKHPAAGMAIHFLKTIGQPWEGEFLVDSEQWKGKRLLANVKVETYNNEQRNKIASIKPLATTQPEVKVDEEIPF